MKPKTRSPFAGRPLTYELRDSRGRRTGFRIHAAHIGPVRAQIADVSAKLTSAGLCLLGFVKGSRLPPGAELEFAAMFMVPLIAWPLFGLAWRRVLRTTKVLEIRQDVFRINGLFGWTGYDRNLPHAFALLGHDRAENEAEQNDLKARRSAQKGRLRTFPKYFRQSRHVVFVYVGQRIDIADVYGLKDARALQTRLAACDAFMDALRGPGDGPASDPDEDWSGAQAGL